MDKVVLNVIYRNGITIKIPFEKLPVLDEFTGLFDNTLELGNKLIRILDLDILENSVLGGYVTYYKEDQEKTRVVEIDKPIKYSSDEYKLDDLKDMYCQFFIDDRNRIKKKEYGLCNVKHNAIKNFVDGVNNSIGDFDIRRAVDSYFKNGYLKRRDAYFNLKKEEYLVSKKQKERKELEGKNLNSFNTNDEYFKYLKEYANLGEEEYAKAMDILSGYDIDEIKRGIFNSKYGVFDGAGQISTTTDYEDCRYLALALEKLSGYRLQQIIDMNELNYLDNKKGFTKR